MAIKTIINDSNFHKLDESPSLIIGYIYEQAYVIDRQTEVATNIGDFYGDPTCGIISLDNKWCLIAGASLAIWKPGGQVIKIDDQYLYWVVKITQVSPNEVQLLVDPSWSGQGSIWHFNIDTLERFKIRDCNLNDEFYQ